MWCHSAEEKDSEEKKGLFKNTFTSCETSNMLPETCEDMKTWLNVKIYVVTCSNLKIAILVRSKNLFEEPFKQEVVS